MATTTKSKSRIQPKANAVEKVRRDPRDEQNAVIVAALEECLVAAEAGELVILPWQKDWVSAEGGDMPVSLSTLKRYGGGNVLMLWVTAMLKGYTSKYWGTYDEIAERAGLIKIARPGGKGHFWVSPDLEDGTKDPTPRGVRKGETSTIVQRWVETKPRPKKDAAGNVVLKKDGTPVMETVRFPVVHHVYNADQAEFPEGCKGIPQAPAPQVDDKTPIEVAEALVASYLENGPSLGHGGSQAFYRPSADHVQMPAFADFKSAEGYYSTLYHELTHSTGHESREAREGVMKGTFGAFGDEVYSFEELVAEIGAAFLCGIAGIAQEATFNNSVAYIKHWLEALKNDKHLISKAASQASKAVDRIAGKDEGTQENETQEGGD